MRRRTLLAAGAGAGGIAALGTLSACGKSEEAAPNDGMESVADVSQPPAPSSGPDESPQEWTAVNFSGISFSIPTTMTGPTPHTDWGLYAVSYDLAESDNEFDQRVMVSTVDAVTTADGIRQTTDLINSGLIENYAEIGRVSWQADSNGPAIERIAFYWGPDSTWCGWTWIIATDAGTGVMTLLGTSIDDGLRNGIENTLNLTRRAA